MRRFLYSIFCIGLVIATPFISRSQVTANFSASSTSGCSPIVVNFTDLSTGSPTSWSWDLGNGTTSTIQNPSTTYITSGTYTVTLTASNSSGSNTKTISAYITVLASPTVSFYTSDTNLICAPKTVSFTNTSVPGSAGTAAYTWDFGDGTGSSSTSPPHTYSLAGNYNVTLSVTNSSGCTKSLSKTSYVQLVSKPTAAFTGTSLSACTAPDTVSFTNSSTNATSYSWNFGDGGTSTSTNPSHTYTTTGNYTVTLIAISSGGCSDTLIRNTYVKIGSPHAAFTTSDTVACLGKTISFTNTSTGSFTTTNWSFGDGTISTVTNPAYSYGTSGTFTLKLVIANGTCKDSITKTIVINAKPTAAFTGSPLTGCSVPTSVNFTNSSTGGTSYAWTFGDGGTATSTSPTHSYGAFGSYTVKLVVTNSNGCNDSVTKGAYVSISVPSATYAANPTTGCPGQTVTFSITSGSGLISTYSWDYGDGTTGSSNTHAYGSTGTYNVKLIFTTTSGCTDTITGVSVTIYSKPITSFSASPTSICRSQNVTFTNTTTGATTYTWLFGDGSTTTTGSPLHNYSIPDSFTVTLISNNNGCKDTLTKTKIISVNPPEANYSDSVPCSNRLEVFFKNLSVVSATGTAYYWNFGDGTTSVAKNPIHTYASYGNYTVLLAVYDSTYSCTDTIRKTVSLFALTSSFTLSSTSICKGSSVTVTATNSPFYTYSWNPGGIGSYIYSPSFFTPGATSIKLTVSDIYGCSDTTTKSVQVGGPLVNFSASPTSACLMQTINFTDLTNPGSGNTISSWAWTFGDGALSSSTNPSHAYSAFGSYTVKLIVTDNLGCKDSATKAAYINVSKPTASFSSTDTVVCPGQIVHFSNASTGTATLTYSWSFGDGGTSTLSSPTHAYTTGGIYTVRLITTDGKGCSDTMTKTNFIRVNTLNIGFNMSDSFANCPPLSVNFTNTSSGISSYNWTFGNGGSSVLTNTSTIYIYPGTYTVRLRGTSASGCVDSVSKSVTILGPTGTLSYSPISGCAPTVINLTSLDTNATSITWDMNNGYTSTSSISTTTATSTLSYTYTSAGRFLPLVVLKKGSCSVYIQGIDTIKIDRLDAGFTFSPDSFCNAGTVNFHDTVNYSLSAITSRTWSFGDGGTSTAHNPSHVYATGGNYQARLIFTNATGCSDTITKTVVIYNLPSVNAGADKAICRGNSVNLSVTGATTYSWTPSIGLSCTSCSNPIANPNITSTYIVTGTDTHGCINTDTIIVKVNSLPTVNLGPDKSFCKGGSVSLTATGASTYVWTPTTGLSCGTCANPTATPITTTTYIVTGTDTNSCRASDTIIIKVNPLPIVNAGPDKTICFGSSTTIIVTGATTYTWTPTSGLSCSTCSNPTANPTTTTTYIVTGTDTNSCSGTDTMIVKVNAKPNVNAGPDKTFCKGGSVNLNVTGASTYSWSPTTGLSCSTCSNPVANPVTTTTYIVTGTDSNGCTNTDTIIVKVNPLPAVNAGPDKAVCSGSSVSLSVSGASSYSWSPTTGLSCSICSNPTASPTTTTTYIVTGTDTNSCVNTDTIVVKVNPLPAVNAGPDKSVCKGSSVNLSVSGAATYTWSPTTGLSCTTCSNPTASPATTTTYIVTGTDSNGCVNKDTIVVNVNTLPVVNAGPDAAVCGGISTSLSGSGAVSYLWSPATGLSCTTCATPVASPTTTTTYILKGTDANGCVNTDTVIVTIHPLPIVNAGADQIICAGTSVTLTATGASTYSWAPSTGLSCFACAAPVATPAATTAYIVTGTDSFGCKNNDTVNVTVKPLPVVNAGPDQSICIGSSVKLTGLGAVSYKWSPATGLSCTNCDTTIASPSATTTYTLTGTGANDCTNTDQVVVTVNPLPVLTLTSDTSLCNGSSVALNVSGAVSYVWSPATALSCTTCSNPVANPGSNISYSVLGTDKNGCISTGKVNITIIYKQPITIGPNDSLCLGQSAQLNATGGTSYLWIPAAGLDNNRIANPTANPDTTTLYKVIVTQGYCFVDSAYEHIVVYPIPHVSLGGDQTILAGTTVQLYATTKGAVSYAWTPATDLSCADCPSPTATPKQTTKYTVFVTGVGGCNATDNITINVRCDNTQVFVPNTFTPNGDGLNDKFYPSGKGIAEIKRFSIYNRWGELVFDAQNIPVNDQSYGWDGRVKGQPVKPDVFVYIINATCESGDPLILKGDVSLVR